MVGPAVKREGVAHLQAVMGLSERRACSIVGADRKMIRYRSRRPPDTDEHAEKGPAIKGSDAGPRNACTGIEPARAPAQGGKRETPSVHSSDSAAMREFH